MAKQLNVNLAFSADTSQAKAQIQGLQNSLNSLLSATNLNKTSLGLNKEINEAIGNVAKLKVQLESATNVKTGQLDLGKFNESLKKSGMKISDYAKSLSSLGPDGDKAFSQLARAITTAEVPLRRTNGLLAEFGTTLKNTARWQISSSVLHGLQGAMSSAWGYAKDLNESLTDIRIVTGQSTDQMAKFAEQANKAAKSLGTTTTKYTDAALIYYQQGLSDEEVIERTDVTTKMANVTGENAADVSSYMTAVWNNFNKAGDESAEHYADIMTKLGAETAASTDEIAAGLSKFSAVADTIGLSFDMASSAVTAIIDQTRESPEVVGTALKTIFSRIEGLKQGETLEDGTDLNKYSQGLATAGISIKDSNDELKDADTILTEIGNTWKDLNKEQQVALAQTVAGTRQYNQFVALFDNWDKVQENLSMASIADGTLQEQSDIYAESWEAASNRVRAAWEGIYDSLLDDNFIIDLTNDFANFLSLIEKLIDGMGGFKSVLLVVGSVLMKTFRDDMTKSLENMVYNIKINTGAAKKEILDLRRQANEQLKQRYENSSDPSGKLKSNVYSQQGQLQDTLLIKQQEMLKNGKQLTEEERNRAKVLMDITNSMTEQTVKTADQRTELTKNTNLLKTQIEMQLASITGGFTQDPSFNIDKMMKQLNAFSALTKEVSFGQNVMNQFGESYKKALQSGDISKITNEMKTFLSEADKSNVYLGRLKEELQAIAEAKSVEELKKAFGDLKQKLMDDTQEARKFISSIREIANTKLTTEEYNALNNKLKELENTLTQTGKLTEQQVQELMKLRSAANGAGNEINGFSGKTYTAADGITALSSMMMNLAMAWSAIKNLGSIWSDEDTTTGEKILQTMTNMAMILPALVALIDKENYKKLAVLGTDLKSLPITIAKIAGYTGEAVAADAATEATFALGGAVKFLLSSFGPLLLMLGLLAGAFYINYKQTHQAREKFKELSEAAEESSNALSKVKTEAQNVNSALDSLSSKTKALNDLKMGSAEWASAVSDVNKEIRDLIDSQNELATQNPEDFESLKEGDDYFRDSRGVLQLTESGQKKIQENQNTRVQNAIDANNATQKAKEDSEYDAKKEEILYDYDNRKNEIPKHERKEKPGTTPSLGEDTIDTVVESINNETIKTDQLDDIEKLKDLGLNEKQAQLIASNENLRNSIEELALTTKENTQIQAQRVEENLLNNDEVYKTIYGKDSKVDEELRSGTLSAMSEDVVKIANDKAEKIDSETIEKNKDAYAQAQGWTKDEKTGEYADSEGKEVKVTSEAVKQWLALADAEEEATKNVKKYVETAKKSEDNWKAAEKIQKPLKEYIKLTEKSGKLTKKEEAAKKKYITQIKSSLGDLLDISNKTAKEFLNPDFVEENADLIQDAIDGDADALRELQMIATKEIITKIAIDNKGNKEEALAALAEIEKILPDLEVGATIEESGIRDQLTRILKATGMTAEQMESLLSLTGFEGAEVEFKQVHLEGVTSTSPGHYEYVDEEGNKHVVETKDVVTGPDGNFYYPVIKGGNYNPTIDKINLGSDSGSSGSSDADKGSGGGGGGGSKTKVEKVDRTKKADVVERYKEINDALEDQAKLLDKINDKTDRLYGKKRIDNLKKVNQELKDENTLLKRKEKEAGRYLKQDRKSMQKSLDKARKKAGLKEANFKFDKDGDIINYTAQMEALYNKLSKLEIAYNRKYAGKVESEASKRAKKRIDDLKQYIQDVGDAVEQYDETKTTKEEAKQKRLENNLKKKENNYEMLSHEIEVRVTINDNDKRQLDYYFNKLSDDVYKAAEALGVLYDPKKNDQIDNAQKALQNNSKAVDDLKKAYKNGKITQADYVEGLQDQYDSILDNLEALQDLDKQMQEYYGETLDLAAEELAKYTDHMDSLNGVLEHYKSVLELTGRGQDYKAIDTILQGQSKTLKNNYEVSKKNYEMLLAQKKTVEARIASMKESDAAYIIEKKKLDDLIAATDEAYDEMLGDAEDYLSNLQALWENAMEQIKKTTGEALTGGVGFDTLVDSMNNLKNYQDEYLTNTNKLFETNKLLSLVQKDIDKTNNVAAKSRLNNFAKEIEQLQKKDKLSNLELEIAQAKYKQLQAQIALEEAQNAKSIVRLSRDNEGNYGYVYTADQDAISDAEDQLSQAENDLYNIRLNATNEYGEKMVQAWQDYMNKCDEVTRNHVGTEEELNEKLRALQDEYYRNINAYSDLYAIAQEEDTRVVADAWINQFDAIKENGDSWKTTLNDYTDQIMNKFREWQATSEEITTAIGANMDTLATSVNDVTNESDAMAKTVVNKVIPALEDELTAVDELTAAYGRQRQEILDTIAAMEQLARLTKADIDAQSGFAGNTEWNKYIDYRADQKNAKWIDADSKGKKHYSTKSEESLNNTIERAENLSDKADEVNEKRAGIINKRVAKGETVYSGVDKYGILHYAKTKKKLNDLIREANAKDAPEFDTGGYTGKWGPEGKLAMLHEKELVLNKEDSANILKVVELVRAMIDNNAAQAGLGTLRASSVADNRQTLEQSVTITAEFPNATDHNEIELAFDSLINRATQYANRK